MLESPLQTSSVFLEMFVLLISGKYRIATSHKVISIVQVQCHFVKTMIRL